MHEAQVGADVVFLISTWEDLGTELTADVSVRGELRHQDAAAGASCAVGGVWQGVPTAAQAVVHRNAGSCFERILPRAWHQISRLFSHGRSLGQAHSHVAVERQFRNHVEHGAVDVAWGCSTQRVLVEACGGVQFQGKLVVARQAGQHIAFCHVQVDAVGFHAGQFTVRMRLHQLEAQAHTVHAGFHVERILTHLAGVDCVGVLHRHFVRALHSVVLGNHSELRCCGVFHSDHLRAHSFVATVVGRSERALDGVVAGGVAWHDFSHQVDGQIRASAGVLKAQVCTHVVHLVSTWEQLGAELTADVAVGGELSHQDAAALVDGAVGCEWQGVPTAAQAVVHRDAGSCFEGRPPRAWHQICSLLSHAGSLGQAHGHVAVEGQLRNHVEHGAIDVAWGGSTQHVLVEACGGVQLQGKLVVARQAGQHVAFRSLEVHAVGLHASQLTFVVRLHEFQAQTNALHSGGVVKRVVTHLTVVVSVGVLHGHLVRAFHSVILRQSQHRSSGVLHRDDLHRRGAVAGLVHRQERAANLVRSRTLDVDDFHRFGEVDLAAVVRVLRSHLRNVVRAFHSVVRWGPQFRCSGVLDHNDLGRGGAVATIVGRSERALEGVVPVVHEVGDFFHQHDGQVRAVALVLEAHVRSNVVLLVSLREDLGAELAAHISVRGQLRDQDALVVAGHAVGGIGRHVPTAAEGAVDDQVVSSFKLFRPCAHGSTGDGRNEGCVLLTSTGGTVQAEGDVRVVRQGRNRVQRHVAQHRWRGGTEWVLVEACGGVQLQGEVLAAREAGHDVAGRSEVEVNAVGLHAGQFTVEVLGHQFEAHAVAFN